MQVGGDENTERQRPSSGSLNGRRATGGSASGAFTYDDGTSNDPHQPPREDAQSPGPAVEEPDDVDLLDERDETLAHTHYGNGNGNGEANPVNGNGQQPKKLPPAVHANSNGSNGATIKGGGGSFDAAPRVFGDVVLRLRGVSKSFTIGDSNETVVALQSVTLDDGEHSFPPIRKGEFVMIRGPSGGGKTTLLNMIGTLDAPTTGEVELMGSVVDKGSSDEYLSDLRLKNIGFVFQTFNLIATMSAQENVELPMTLLGEMDEKARRQRAKQLLTLVGLRNRAKHLPSELSGGEQQRVTIARALANNPSFLLLDEPTGDLDTQTTTEVMDLLLHINRMAGMTCLMVTHNPDVECYADRILYVSDGRFVEQVDNEEPFSLNYDSYQQYLLKKDALPTTTLFSST